MHCFITRLSVSYTVLLLYAFLIFTIQTYFVLLNVNNNNIRPLVSIFKIYTFASLDIINQIIEHILCLSKTICLPSIATSVLS